MEKALVLIVEDQAIISKSIESMITDHGMEVIGVCGSGEDAIQLAEQRPPDIVIMDIKLQGKLDGIQTATAIKEMLTVPVIFLSDYTDAATVRKAKTAHPANYLSKPFTEKDLLRAIDIAIYNANASRANGTNEEQEFIFLKTGQSTYSRLEYNNIIYLEADRAYCNIKGTDKMYTVSTNMSSVHEQLNQDRFVKIHRSYVVNIRKVREFNGTELVVAGYKLPVSDQHRAELMNRLKVLH